MAALLPAEAPSGGVPDGARHDADRGAHQEVAQRHRADARRRS